MQLKPTAQLPESAPSISTVSEAEQVLQRRYEDQEQLIATLKQQLAELRPSADLGSALVGQGPISSADVERDRAPVAVGVPQIGTYISLQQKAEQQAETIANLRQQISEARSLAAIADTRLNKWRRRTFS